MSSRVTRTVEIMVIVVTFIAWWLLLRFWLVQGDDFISATVGNSRGGRPSITGIIDYARIDYTAGTGRQAGTLFRIAQLGGEEAIRWVLPLHQVLLAFGILWWTRRTGLAPWISWALMIASVTAFPILALHQPGLMGAAAVWAQASFDYVSGPALCLLALAAMTTDKPPGRVLTTTLVPVALLAGLNHESGSVAILVAVAGLAISRQLPRARSQRVLLVALVVGAIAQVASPGMWNRLDQMEGKQPTEHGWRLAALRGANAVGNLADAGTGLVLGTLVVLLLAVTMMRTRGRPRIAALVAALSTLGLSLWWPLFKERTAVRSYAESMTQSDLKLVLVGIGLACLTGLSLLVSLATARSLIGSTRPLVALLATAGSFAPAFAAGITALRAAVPTTMWLVGVLLTLISDLCVEPKGRNAAEAVVPRRIAMVALLVVVAAGLWSAPQWWWASWQGMRENHRVYARVEAQVERVHRGQSTTITFPARYPHPELMYYNAYLLTRYSRYIIEYYDLPAGTMLVDEPR